MEKKIYRYIGMDDFLWLLLSRKTAFRLPTQWQDPYEGYLFKALADKDRAISIIGSLMSAGKQASNLPIYRYFSKLFFSRHCVYAQCWTLDSAESDAWWKIFSYGSHSVRIESTVESFRNAVINGNNSGSCNVIPDRGEVRYDLDEYKTPEEFVSKRINAAGLSTFDTLLCKRKAFAHEKEYRFLFYDEAKYGFINACDNIQLHNSDDYVPNAAAELFDYIKEKTYPWHSEDMSKSIDVAFSDLQWIDSVLLHPQADETTAGRVQEVCDAKGISFSHSKLYAPPFTNKLEK